MRKFFAPEVVQTSSLDCGPASLKCLLEGFARPVSYGRLREACQTGLDGTSIDTMETVANQLGLEAEQIMLPVDHLLASEAKALPAIVVVTLANGLTHFVVAWRRHGNLLQVMDPAVGRRWMPASQFASEVYSHNMVVSAAAWREFAASDEFQSVLRARLRRAGASERANEKLLQRAHNSQDWRGMAALDAATRLVTALHRAGGLPQKRHTERLLNKLCAQPEMIPQRYWSVTAAPPDADGDEQVTMSGAVLVRVKGRKATTTAEQLSPELAAAVEPRVSPGRELLCAFWRSEFPACSLLLIGILAAAAGVLLEALLFRGLLDISSVLGLAGQRMGAMAALLLFSLALLLVELPIFATGARLGRQLETRLRTAFLEKIPRLGDRYFQSRLTSDMAERSHATHRLRHLPFQVRELLAAICQLGATAAGIVWLEPSAAALVALTVAAALLPAFSAQSLLAERDLRARTHAAGLTRFYLDAMLGLLAIRTHGAERSVRCEHEKLLGKWADAALRLQRAVVTVEAVQLVAMFGLVAALLVMHPLTGTQIGRVLLVVYWALNLPVLGQEIAALTRQYPYYRNVTLRLLEPLGAAEETNVSNISRAPFSAPPAIEFRQVSVEASGHQILTGIDLSIEAGAHVAIVGPSGAGKSSLVGILLGWLKPNGGSVLVDGKPLDCQQLRISTAWIDPAVQLWNRSLLSNLTYGLSPDPQGHQGSGVGQAPAVGQAIDLAMLRNVLESLPEGLQTKLGEGGSLVSGGEGQRVRLARAMLRNQARLVILDEPFRGLDREKRRELLARARELWRGATLLCITHDLLETQGFDRVVVIEHGRIAEQGTPTELYEQIGSRYSQLLTAEKQAFSGLWAAGLWRRIRMHSGRIVEELPPPAEDNRPESEVA